MYRVSLSSACQKSLSYHIMSLNSMYAMKNISDNLHLITRTLQGFSIKGEMTRSKSESSMAAAAKYLGVPKSVNKQQRCFFILSNTSASWEHLHYWIVNHLWKFMDTSCFLKLLLDWSQYWYWWNHTNINKKIKINDKELYNSGNLGIIRKIVWQKKSCPDQCTQSTSISYVDYYIRELSQITFAFFWHFLTT